MDNPLVYDEKRLRLLIEKHIRKKDLVSTLKTPRVDKKDININTEAKEDNEKFNYLYNSNYEFRINCYRK